jgi:hypothetical protein
MPSPQLGKPPLPPFRKTPAQVSRSRHPRKAKLPLIPEAEITDHAFIATILVVGAIGVIDLPLAIVIAGAKILSDSKHHRALAALGEGIEEGVK